MKFYSCQDNASCLFAIQSKMHASIQLKKKMKPQNKAAFSVEPNNDSSHDVEIERIFEALQNTETVQRFSFQDVGMGPQFAVQLAEIFEVNRSITECDLSGNPIGPHGAQCLAAALATNKILKSLDVSNCRLGTDGINQWSAMLINAEESGLRNVAMKLNQIDDEGARSLANAVLNTKLAGLSLDLRANHISDVGLNEISQALKDSSMVCSLRLQGNHASHDFQSMRFIEHRLRANRKLINKEVLERIMQQLSLSDQDLEACLLADIDIDALASLRLSNCIKRNKRLLSLELKNNSFTNEGSIAMAKALKQNVTLMDLAITNNCVGNSAFQQYARTIAASESLLSFKVSNAIGLLASTSNATEEFSIRSAGIFAKAFSENFTVLRVLHLCHVGMHDVPASVLFSGIAWRSMLRELNVRDNYFGDYVQHTLSILLQRNPYLELLDISNNRMTSQGLLPLMRVVPNHPSIARLRLGRFSSFDPSLREVCHLASKSGTLIEMSIDAKIRRPKLLDLLGSLKDKTFKPNQALYADQRATEETLNEHHRNRRRRLFWLRRVPEIYVEQITHITPRLIEASYMYKEELLSTAVSLQL